MMNSSYVFFLQLTCLLLLISVEGDEKVLAVLAKFVAAYIASHFPTYVVPPTCIPTIAKLCGWKVSLRCLKDVRQVQVQQAWGVSMYYTYELMLIVF